LNINIEKSRGAAKKKEAEARKSLKRFLLEKVQEWINHRFESERDEFLGRGCYETKPGEKVNYGNGYRSRRLTILG
jgi:hypothetical protein